MLETKFTYKMHDCDARLSYNLNVKSQYWKLDNKLIIIFVDNKLIIIFVDNKLIIIFVDIKMFNDFQRWMKDNHQTDI